jgi:hypothetical protein
VSVVAVVAAVAVGVVFLAAGVTKLAGRERWRTEAGGMGTPGWLVPVVPWVELLLGALLVSQLLRPVVAGVAALVLLVFTLRILQLLAEGDRPPCACFGSWSSRPLGPWHVVRNVTLIVVAMVAALL